MTDPVEVLLRFAFIGVLYLFLLWVARSALKDLRTARSASAERDAASVTPPPCGTGRAGQFWGLLTRRTRIFAFCRWRV